MQNNSLGEGTKKLLSRLRLRIPEEKEEALLVSLLLEAEEYIKAATKRKTLPSSLEYTQIELAVCFYNRLGMEGISRSTEGPVTQEFKDIPDHISAMIRSKRLLMGE